MLPLAISDLPVFLRWRGEPPFGETQWEQLVGVADRVIVDSSEWGELRYHELADVFERTAVSDIAWARTDDWRIALAAHWPAIASQEIAIRGPRAEAALLRGWLASRLDRDIAPVEPAGELGVRLDGEEVVPSHADGPIAERPAERRARQARARPRVRAGGLRAGRARLTRPQVSSSTAAAWIAALAARNDFPGAVALPSNVEQRPPASSTTSCTAA